MVQQTLVITIVLVLKQNSSWHVVGASLHYTANLQGYEAAYWQPHRL